VHFQSALTSLAGTAGFLKPPSGGFPEGLLDRAFYARVAAQMILKARFNGLKVEGF
jgi:hypothetical protein